MLAFCICEGKRVVSFSSLGEKPHPLVQKSELRGDNGKGPKSARAKVGSYGEKRGGACAHAEAGCYGEKRSGPARLIRPAGPLVVQVVPPTGVEPVSSP